MNFNKILIKIIDRIFLKPQFRKLKVVSVDDLEYYSKLVQINLEKIGFKDIISFNNGEDLVEYIKTNKPDCIVLDHILSKDDNKMKGADVLKYVKDNYPEINVIILSGQDDMNVATKMIKDGAYDYIIKNDMTFFNLKNIITKLEKYINLKELNKQRERIIKLLFFLGIVLIWVIVYIIGDNLNL